MSGIDFHIEFEGDLLDQFTRATEQAEDLSRPMREIAAVLQDGVRDRFETGTDPLGVPWKKSQRALKTGGKTLIDSGDLLNSIASESGRDFALVGVLRNAGLGHDGASVKDYAAIHQFGGTITPKKKKALSWSEGYSRA